MRTCPSCGGVIGRDCFNPVECAHISNSIQEDHINRLEALAATEKHFSDESKEQQESINERDLKELKHYYGSWEELREVIKRLEENENEARWYRSQNDH